MGIRQSVSFDTTPERVYQALTSAKEFSEWTGAPAQIVEDEGGNFSCFGGQITGRNIELSPSRRIVQAWRAGPWPDSVYSVVKFDISKSGASTKVNLEHTGYPEGGEDHLEDGWHKMYWEPLKAYFA